MLLGALCVFSLLAMADDMMLVVDVVFDIMTFADLKTLASLRLVCHQFSTMAIHESVWRRRRRMREQDWLPSTSLLPPGVSEYHHRSLFLNYCVAERITDFLNHLGDRPPRHRYAQLQGSPDLSYTALKSTDNGQTYGTGPVRTGYLIRATFRDSSPRYALVVSRGPAPAQAPAPTPIAGAAPMLPAPAPAGDFMVMFLNSDGSGYTTERLSDWIRDATSAHFAVAGLATEKSECVKRAQMLGSMPWDPVGSDVWDGAAFVVFCMIGQYVQPDLINRLP
ncbi:F-box domain containing protein [Pandoravirus neocaledonia]|uniref:F-box domain containing protein n=1 Tax=Pandoravirus neocaledonia TaxID=2107708 RepID=A0A2U7UB96_9VIRU|nr:F-box domain containing protein [Pandoravirus neocaledonia]AVK75719.1 F-box domain containing protein [Pandoravirus neocaledonia]